MMVGIRKKEYKITGFRCSQQYHKYIIILCGVCIGKCRMIDLPQPGVNV